MNRKIERVAREMAEKTRSIVLAYSILEVLWTFVIETVI